MKEASGSFLWGRNMCKDIGRELSWHKTCMSLAHFRQNQMHLPHFPRVENGRRVWAAQILLAISLELREQRIWETVWRSQCPWNIQKHGDLLPGKPTFHRQDCTALYQPQDPQPCISVPSLHNTSQELGTWSTGSLSSLLVTAKRTFRVHSLLQAFLPIPYLFI